MKEVEFIYKDLHKYTRTNTLLPKKQGTLIYKKDILLFTVIYIQNIR